jgi:hypothetical protein
VEAVASIEVKNRQASKGHHGRSLRVVVVDEIQPPRFARTAWHCERSPLHHDLLTLSLSPEGQVLFSDRRLCNENKKYLDLIYENTKWKLSKKYMTDNLITNVYSRAF